MSGGPILLGCTTLTLAVLMVAQQPDALTAAARSLGASSVRTLQFTGSGATSTVTTIAPFDDNRPVGFTEVARQAASRQPHRTEFTNTLEV